MIKYLVVVIMSGEGFYIMQLRNRCFFFFSPTLWSLLLILILVVDLTYFALLWYFLFIPISLLYLVWFVPVTYLAPSTAPF